MDVAKTRYIFWLRWRKDVESSDEIVKCVIDAQKLIVIADPPYSLPLRRIVECRAVFVPRYTHYVELVVWGESQPWKILGPVNPFFGGSDQREVDAMVKVINGLKSGAKIALDPDPYKRQLKYNKRWVRAGDTYDANISPMIYYRARLEPSLRKVYWVLGIALAFMFVMNLVVEVMIRYFGFR
jgi:hypothetical protein